MLVALHSVYPVRVRRRDARAGDLDREELTEMHLRTTHVAYERKERESGAGARRDMMRNIERLFTAAT